MSTIKNMQEQHTAGPQAIGFDYQFYYFMFLALELKHGQKVGFEVKDDVHIDKQDGTTVLFQAKHSSVKKSNDSVKNLTTLDVDLWKTLSNWTDFIKSDKSNFFIDKHSFVLVTNKSENNNEFISLLAQFKIDNNIDIIKSKIRELEKKTQDKTLKNYIDNVVSLPLKKLKLFLSKLFIETSVDDIIGKIKERILERVMQDKFVDIVFEKLSSNMQMQKYTDIKNRTKFEISFEDFKNKFGRCFQNAYIENPLPRRSFPILLPDDLESQIFIKQLIDIGEIQSDSKEIRDYTTQMLKFLNHVSFWIDDNHVLPTDMEEFKRESIQLWFNEFRSKYRKIEGQITDGTPLNDLDYDIKELGIELVDYIRKQNLSISGYPALGVEFSNGHYYALSDSLEIGWHFDWKNKYNLKITE